MKLQIRAHATSSAGAANEDIAGTAGRFAWIVDGASGVGARNLTSAMTDAAWLALSIDRILRERIGEDGSLALHRLLARLERELARQFTKETSAANVDPIDAPSACLALVELVDAGDGRVRLAGAIIGDVCVFVPGEAGLARWTDERLKSFEAKTLDALAREPRVTFDVPGAVLDQIRNNRRWLNRDGGYFAVHPRLPWADHVLSFETSLPAGNAVVLATDGFLRLSDLFGAMDVAQLCAAVRNGEADSLVVRLRRLEQGDPFGLKHLRVKPHDDATVLAVDLGLETVHRSA
jgi:hypothetical protein